MQLAVFMGCKTGDTSDIHGNLVDLVTSKSASCALGWKGDTGADGYNNYSKSFWTALFNNKTILAANNEGKQTAKDDPKCKNLGTGWEYCKLDNLYYQGSGCNNALPYASSVHRPIQSQEIESSLSTSSQMLQEYQAIVTFSGDKKLDPVFKESVSYPYGTLDIFEVNSATYKVNRNTGSVQSMYNTLNVVLKPEINVNSLDQGYSIAEIYAKAKAPKIWENTSHEIMTIKSANMTVPINELAYSWRQYFITPTVTSINFSEIAGYNQVDITLDPHDGMIRSYHEWNMPLDKNLNFVPAISEGQAWEAAQKYFERRGITMDKNVEKKALGLSITTDNGNNQHLTWTFYVLVTSSSGFVHGGFIGIAANNGQEVWFWPIN